MKMERQMMAFVRIKRMNILLTMIPASVQVLPCPPMMNF